MQQTPAAMLAFTPADGPVVHNGQQNVTAITAASVFGFTGPFLRHNAGTGKFLLGCGSPIAFSACNGWCFGGSHALQTDLAQ